MEVGIEPLIMRWDQEEKRTTDNEMEVGREPKRMRWN
jgi:hypothetical protein